MAMKEKGVRKEYVSQTFKLTPGLVERLDSYSKSTGVSKTFAAEKALTEYLDKYAPDDKK